MISVKTGAYAAVVAIPLRVVIVDVKDCPICEHGRHLHTCHVALVAVYKVRVEWHKCDSFSCIVLVLWALEELLSEFFKLVHGETAHLSFCHCDNALLWFASTIRHSYLSWPHRGCRSELLCVTPDYRLFAAHYLLLIGLIFCSLLGFNALWSLLFSVCSIEFMTHSDHLRLWLCLSLWFFFLGKQVGIELLGIVKSLEEGSCLLLQIIFDSVSWFTGDHFLW